MDVMVVLLIGSGFAIVLLLPLYAKLGKHSLAECQREKLMSCYELVVWYRYGVDGLNAKARAHHSQDFLHFLRNVVTCRYPKISIKTITQNDTQIK